MGMLLRVPFQERRERQGVARESSTEEADKNKKWNNYCQEYITSVIMQHSKVYKTTPGNHSEPYK